MAIPSLKILMVASEATPFAKTGGLADVVGSLPAGLQSQGHQVVLVLPWYRRIHEQYNELCPPRQKLQVPFGGLIRETSLRKTERNSVTVYFIDKPEFYDRSNLYGENGADYPDNAERFGFLSRAALELTRRVSFIPDVIHTHDWQTGLVPVYLRSELEHDPFFSTTGTLFTIHNLGYQGIFAPEVLEPLGLDPRLYNPDGLEYHDRVSLLKGGIRFADEINTVSPTYCREIQTPEFGMGMDGLLRSRADHLHGILNGVDPIAWSPACDQALEKTYSALQIAGKQACKAALQKQLGLPISPDVPLISMITRLDPQKGIDLVLENWDRLMQKDLQLVILGSGRPDYEQRLTECSAFYPERAKVLLTFDDVLSRRIYAGSDLFLMPSRYEPCGLGQLIALRYGCVPVVHATGGLIDTISDPLTDPKLANGFVFTKADNTDLLRTLDRALESYQDHDSWSTLQRQGMQQDLSWNKAAREYVHLYEICRKGAA